MRARLALLVTVVILIAVPPLVEAVTVRDIIELSRGGLDAQVLVALIETDGSRFNLEPAQILELKAAGVASEVIIAMLRSGRAGEQQPIEVAGTPEGTWAGARLIEEWDRRRSRHERRRREFVSIPIPLFVPFVPLYGFHGHVIQRHIPAPALDPSQFSSFGTGFTSCLSSGSCLLSPGSFAEPVYWGWGGKRRPDTWEQPAATDRQK